MSLLVTLLGEGSSTLVALVGFRLEVGADMVECVAKLGEDPPAFEARDALIGAPRLLIQHEDLLQVLCHLFDFL